MASIIRVQGLGKCYHLGGPALPYATLRESIMEFARKPVRALRKNGNSPTLWALKDLNLEIAPGEIVGIIGRNGAGKSTLLKILSRIIEPTVGRVELYGSVASLLEVGTGFHPELTGRENVFLNGSILGMPRREIEGKFDDIVSFAEVEKFIDTPVKRYSSGMYVRLAFAVAAHLEPEILVIDEVLAVGDYAFQQKCLNKMHDVSTQGRTVLFVSHNMGAINRLCTRAVLLEQGQLLMMGPTSDVVQKYIMRGGAGNSEFLQEHKPEKAMNLRRVKMQGPDGENRTKVGYHESFSVILEYEVNEAISNGAVGIGVFTFDGTCAFLSGDFDTNKAALGLREVGYYRAEIEIPGRWLNVGRYSISVYISSDRGQRVFDRRETLIFDIADTGTPGSLHGINRQGILQPVLNWKTSRVELS